MKRGTRRSRLPTLLALLLAAGGLAPDLRAQAAAPTAAAPAAPAGVRTLYLVRHGAYDIDDPRDEAVGRGLLPIGVAQARLTGDRLRGLPFTLDSIVASPLTRARETAEVIAAELAIGHSGGPGVGLRSRSRRVHAAHPARRHHGEGEAGGAGRLQRAARAPRGAAARTGAGGRPARARRRARQRHPLAGDPRPGGRFRRPGSACRSATPASRCSRSTARAWCASSPSATSATSRPGCRPAPTAIARTGI